MSSRRSDSVDGRCPRCRTRPEYDQTSNGRRRGGSAPPSTTDEERRAADLKDMLSDIDMKVQYAMKCARLLPPPQEVLTPVQLDTPPTAPAISATQQVYLPRETKVTQHATDLAEEMSPPRSKSWDSSTAATSESGSPQSEKAVTALPGTMSARTYLERPPKSRGRTSSARRAHSRPNLTRRWTLKVRDLFTHHPVDVSQFERIEGRHWAEED